MDKGGILLIIGTTLMAIAVILYIDQRSQNKKTTLRSSSKLPPKSSTADQAASPTASLASGAREEVDHIFNEEFREELRNRGRLHFEKVIGESAMFLQQDLRQTTTQLNDYMRDQITRTLQVEFKKYEQSITDAKQIALDSIEKTVATIEQQRTLMETQMETQAEKERLRIVERFESQLASVVNHYVMQAIGDQIDLSDQLEFILAELENNKAAIIEDIRRGS